MKDITKANITQTCLDNQAYCQAVVNAICEGFSTGDIFLQLTNQWNESGFFQFYGFFSALLNLWFASLIWRHKELQVHPMRLMMWIAIVDCFYFSN